MRKKLKTKYASIILVHYSLVDDYGGKKAWADQDTRSEMLKQSISSIVENTSYPAELIVMDNGGNPDDSDYLLDLARKGVINTYVRYSDNMQLLPANGFILSSPIFSLLYLGCICETISGVATKRLSLFCSNNLIHSFNQSFFTETSLQVNTR